MSDINKQARDKLKSAAAKAADNFDPNMFVETRDVLALLDELEAAGRQKGHLREQHDEWERKAAIHDGLCEKYNVESLADFVDWQRNHIAELEAAPPAPVGEGETAVMPDYPGYVMTQRECFQAGKKAGLAEPVTTAYKFPELTDSQCLEFLAVAFRHARIKGDIEFNDIRLGLKMALWEGSVQVGKL